MTSDELRIRPVADDGWEVVSWLWQAFRQDLAPIVQGLPYADGRYARGPLDRFPSSDGCGYLALRPHPNTGEAAPVGFALVDGLTGARRGIAGFWVAPAARSTGIGRSLARHVLMQHPGGWRVGFQEDNASAGRFWRKVADDVFGARGWTETARPVPHRPLAPPDHFIESR